MSCSAEGCPKPVWARDLCGAHYQRAWQRGELRRRTAEERFWAKVDKTVAVLAAVHSQHGYERFLVNRRLVPAHRFAYELLVGPIPEGLPSITSRRTAVRQRSASRPSPTSMDQLTWSR